MSKFELKAKKSLGQNFLNSPSAISKIIQAAEIATHENVLEIGPGTGILTRSLLDAGAIVTAIEKDVRAYEVLLQKFAQEIGEGRLRLSIGDVLDRDALKNFSHLKSGEFSLVANIPYYITGAILEKFLEHEPRPNKMVLLVQKEVAERILARDGKESILSISVKAFGIPQIVSIVPRGAFVPTPKVDSAIIKISNISNFSFTQNNLDIKPFFRVLKAGFAHKRKILIRNLEECYTNISPSSKTKADFAKKLTGIWKNIGLGMKVRAEDLSTEQWLQISGMIFS